MTASPTLDSAAVLDAARRYRWEADAAEAALFGAALRWAELHAVGSDDSFATWGDSPVPLAGEGAPLVAELSIADFAAAIGRSTESGRSLIAHALEIAYRLPRIWARVQCGELPTWRARRIAEKTISLSPQAADYVDVHLAPFADRVGVPTVERLVDEAINRFMPTRAEEIAAAAADHRHVTLVHDQRSFAGTGTGSLELDLPDLLDLDQAVQAGADQLRDLGCELGLDARRALALGNLARGDVALPLDHSRAGTAAGQVLGEDGVPLKPPVTKERQVVLYVHLSQDALGGHGTGYLENGKHAVTADQIREWCRSSGRVTVRPVIDLNEEITTPGYRPSDRLREQVILRDRFCVFPHCERNARLGDQDHIDPFDPGGSEDQTSTSRLGSLCRRHHRVKTFTDWTYTMIEPGVFLWRSPHGYQYLRDQSGTRDVTPRPVDPPGSSLT